jgi:hypothetical protein
MLILCSLTASDSFAPIALCRIAPRHYCPGTILTTRTLVTLADLSRSGPLPRIRTDRIALRQSEVLRQCLCGPRIDRVKGQNTRIG